MSQSEDLSPYKQLLKTRQVSERYFERLQQVGLPAPEAAVISQALARFRCEQVPLNTLQRQTLRVCWDWVATSGLVRDRKVIPFPQRFVKRP
ncbi:MAG: hypothetical protein F6J97_02535 [Leptolyngbya sp. SIO4C1]|nr:hypothetical protein [Leptolyngbya sp. SIO4C1]